MRISTKKKAPKGTVSVQVFKDRLRLCWSYCRKRYFLYIGLPDSNVNRIVAEQKAKQIAGDMATGNFDSSLKKYKIEYQQYSPTTIPKLFKRFTAEKAKEVSPKTVEKYRATLGYLDRYFGDAGAESINNLKAEDFARHLKEKSLSPNQCKRRLEELKACWNWAIAKNLISPENPWIEVAKRVKVPPKQKPKPFSKEEIGAIEQGFRTDRYYSYYADFVQFLFGTGCRTGEAIGLRWKHLSDNCSTVWIGESVSRRIRKSTKTNRARTISLTPRLQVMLLKRKPTNADPEDLVFRSAGGKVIDDQNFRNRAWIKVLTRIGIEYRKPYTTRHSLISHALDLGMNPVNVAQLTGHDVRTLYENYAGNVNSRSLLPEL
ncbi:site-specific integrase [Merismopedia glauca CCAP 1448/3]|uniref:Site-specific integrase n=1 Tax=Merismopedia glauca CCAP 1448/3 TaxID=1296344 RepID=A0A2T1C0T2_9CYAN|nr:site-specific integrase [Merismopedia glauca CCAP 1448/3]